MKRNIVLVGTSLVLAGCASHPRMTSRTAYTPPIYNGNDLATPPAAVGGPGVSETGTASSLAPENAQTVNQVLIPLHREELVVGKRDVPNGGVLVRTVVRTEQVSEPVELRREEYTVQRIPANQAPPPGDTTPSNAFQQQEFFIPLTREEPVVSKRTLITETVRVGKRVETEHQTVHGQVRSEDVQVVNTTQGAAPGATAPIAAAPAAGETAAPATPALEPTPANGDAIQLAREELVVGKRPVESGGAIVRKIVRTQDVNEPVELRREEINIERTPANQTVSAADFQPREIRVDLKREEPVLSTRDYVAEVVRVDKQMHTDRQNVTGTVRQETVDIVQNPPMAAQDRAIGGTGQPVQAGSATATSETPPQPAPPPAPVPAQAPAPAPDRATPPAAVAAPQPPPPPAPLPERAAPGGNLPGAPNAVTPEAAPAPAPAPTPAPPPAGP